MPIQLTAEALARIFPGCPDDIIAAFVAKQSVLDKVAVTENEKRLSYFFANLAHETNNFQIRGLTENINYSPERAAQIWPSRFASAASVSNRFGTSPGWQLKMFDDVYGNRMGNRPGTNDGSRYIGRGGPQWTGREGYEALERLTGLKAVDNPDLATRHELQPEVCAAFWQWKSLNARADAGNFTAVVHAWNGGTIGLEDREARLAHILPIVRGLKVGPTPKAPSVAPKPTAPIAVGVGAAGATGGLLHWLGAHSLTIAFVCIAVAVIAGLSVHFYKLSNQKGDQ